MKTWRLWRPSVRKNSEYFNYQQLKMDYYSDHNNYLLSVQKDSQFSYSSMLYNEEQDDDEMAEETHKNSKQLPTTIELQNQYIGIQPISERELRSAHDQQEIEMQNKTKFLSSAKTKEKEKTKNSPLQQIEKVEPTFESQKQMLFLDAQRQIQDNVHQIMQSKSQFYHQLNERVRLKQANLIETDIFKQRNLLEQPKETDTYLSKKYAQFYQIAIGDRLEYHKNKQNFEVQDEIIKQKQSLPAFRAIKMSDPLYNQISQEPLQGQLYINQTDDLIVDYYDPKQREIRLRGGVEKKIKKQVPKGGQLQLPTQSSLFQKDDPKPDQSASKKAQFVQQTRQIGSYNESIPDSKQQSFNRRYSNNPHENESVDYSFPANQETGGQPELSADVFLQALNKRQQNYLNQERNQTLRPQK